MVEMLLMPQYKLNIWIEFCDSNICLSLLIYVVCKRYRLPRCVILSKTKIKNARERKNVIDVRMGNWNCYSLILEKSFVKNEEKLFKK